MAKRKNLTDMQFGRLIVVSFSKMKTGTAYWNCKCECGNLKEVRGSHLTSGDIVSCGCKRLEYEDLTGFVFSRLKVISHFHYHGHEHFWNCRCECGKELLVGGNWLRSGNTKSCGCLLSEITTKRCTIHGLASGKRSKSYNPEYEKYLRQRPGYILRKNVSCMIRAGLKRKSVSKNKKSAWANLPYSPDELKRHLEFQFEDWMNWDNYGKEWHIDHEMPQSSFSYSSMNDQGFQDCWALSNLRPLKATDNLKKGNKIKVEGLSTTSANIWNIPPMTS